MVTVRSGQAAGLAALVGLLAALGTTIGLGAAGWGVGAGTSSSSTTRSLTISWNSVAETCWPGGAVTRRPLRSLGATSIGPPCAVVA